MISRRTLERLLVLVLVLAAGPSAGEEGRDWRTIPSEICRGLWIVPVTFDGEPGGTLRLVLDTGAAPTTLDPDAIRRVFGREVRAGKKVRLRDLHAGPLRIPRIRVRTQEMDHLARALGSDMDGILGFPVFRDLLLALDYPDGEVRIADGSLPAVDGATVFRDVGDERPYLTLDVGGRPTPVLIDSGSTDGLTLRESDAVTWAVEPRVLSGAVRMQSIRLESTGRAAESFVFGPSVLEQPVIDVIEDGTRLAGWEILRRFEWVFDTRNRRIQMTPDDEAPIRSPPYRGLGVAFRPLDDGLEVVRVFPGTPGADAGVMEGDVVTAVDGVPVYERGCRLLAGDEESAEVLLLVDREGERVAIDVKVGVLVP